MQKILFIVNVDWFFISHRLPIALAAINKGFEVHVMCAVTDKGAELKAAGIIVHPLELSRSGTSLLCEFKTLLQIFSAIKKIKPNIVHSITIKPVLYGNVVARLLKVPIRVSSISGLGYVFIAKGIKSILFRKVISAMYRIALNGAAAIIFQNESDRDVLKHMRAVTPEQEVYIRGSGVALEEYPVVKEPIGAPIVMLVARLLIDKGVNEFVNAAKLLKFEMPSMRLVLVGDLDLENPKSITKIQLDSWLKEGVVEHWGYKYNIAETMAQANIIVLPSYREGLPKSLIEAAACGRAVVTTDVPGCRDAIEVNKTGLLVPVQTVEPLKDAIFKLIDDVELRHSYALAGRRLAEDAFDVKDVVQKHIEIYST